MFEMIYSTDVPTKKSSNLNQEITFSGRRKNLFDFKDEEVRPCGRTTIENHLLFS
jgi:hypothetical protein